LTESGPDKPLSGAGGARTRTVTIANRRGLHARAASKFAQAALAFDAEITVCRAGQSVPGTSILGLMMLAAAPGNEIEISTRGTEAEAALDALCSLVETKFEEE
jgi:phosphocarrier protein HPr